MGPGFQRKPLGRENETAQNKAAGCSWLSITSLSCSPPTPILCAMALSPDHHSAVTWAALPPGKSIFGSSQGSRAWPRLHAKHPHFLLLTASLLYHKLSPFIFFSTRKCCSHWAPTLPRATGPPGSNPSPETLAFCSLHKTHRGFLKPISPCHQTVVFLTDQEKKSSAFYGLGFPFHTSWLSQAAQGPPGGE